MTLAPPQKKVGRRELFSCQLHNLGATRILTEARDGATAVPVKDGVGWAEMYQHADQRTSTPVRLSFSQREVLKNNPHSHFPSRSARLSANCFQGCKWKRWVDSDWLFHTAQDQQLETENTLKRLKDGWPHKMSLLQLYHQGTSQREILLIQVTNFLRGHSALLRTGSSSAGGQQHANSWRTLCRQRTTPCVAINSNALDLAKV